MDNTIIINSNKSEFGRWRSVFWPIHAHELKKLVPMLLISFLITFIHNLLSTLKETLVVTAEGAGAEVIPFIKMWVVFPATVAMLFIYTRLSNRLTPEKVIYAMLSLFLCYFALFAFVLFPMRDMLHPHAFANILSEILPEGCHGFIAMLRNWTFAIFFAMAMLWSSIILVILFWGFANRVTLLGEAKRFYGLFAISANFSGIIAGQVSVGLSQTEVNSHLPIGSTGWEQTLILLTLLILVAGGIILFLFRQMHTSGLIGAHFLKDTPDKNIDKKKEKPSLSDHLRTLVNSKYLMSIAFTVLAYNITQNLIEVLKQQQIHQLFPDPSSYNRYVNQEMTIIGILGTVMALLVSGNSLRKLGWTFTAMLTPAIFLLTNTAFFGAFFLKEQLPDWTYRLSGISPLAIVVFFGSFQTVLIRCANNTVFSATKEIAFIPLSAEAKEHGKAAIDGVCSSFGKAGGAMINQAMLLLFSSITVCAPYIALIIFGIIGIWIVVTRSMGKQFYEMTQAAAPVREKLVPAIIENSTLLTQRAA